MADYETMNFEIKDKVATITLDRPDNANALNAQMARELFEVSIRCTHEDVRAVIFTAKGKMFCAGGDLAEMDAQGDNRPALLTEMATLLHQSLIRFAQIDAPVIMAVNGVAGGGGFSMALSGDFVLAAKSAKFVSAYTASGLTPDGSSTYFLAKHIGLLRAKELLLTNRMLSADDAMEWGMVNRVVEDADLMAEAQKLASGFAKGPSKALGGTKRLLNSAYAARMEEQLELETRSISAMMETHDGPHGLNAFLNKSKPIFKGE